MENDRVQELLQIIRNDVPQREHFFKVLASTDNPIPWLKILQDNGYLDPKDNPLPQETPDKGGYIIPQWNILGFLENVANKNAEIKSEETTALLLEIVNSIINYRNHSGARTDNYWTDWLIIKIIFTFPVEQISFDHVEFVRTALKSQWRSTLVPAEMGKTVLPRLIAHRAKEHVLRLLEVIFDYRKAVKGITRRFTSIMDDYWLSETLRQNKPEISKLCGIQAAGIGLGKIRAITTEDESSFNIVWIPTIENHPQTKFTDSYECQLVQFVRDMFESANPDEIKAEIRKLLEEKHPIFKRIAVHTINHLYDDLKNLFWSWQVNPLSEPFLKHELYELFRSNCLSLEEKQIEKVLEWIESKEYYILEDFKKDEERKEKILAINKKEWLSSLIETKNPKVIETYEKYDKVNPAKLDHPGFDIWTESWWGTTSPVETAELLKKSTPELAEYLNSYQEEGYGKEPSKEGLAEAFRACVSGNPERFSIELEPFLSVHRMYQHSLLWGLLEAWRAKKTFPWGSLLEFMYRILTSEEFWKGEFGTGYNYRDWIISEIASLIEEGTKDDSHAFDPEHLPKTEEILLILIGRAASQVTVMDDLLTAVLNSPKGKLFSAMVDYSLRVARLLKKDQGDRWIPKIKADFSKRLDRQVEPGLEFSVILGEYLPNLYYLDKEWVTENLNYIFPKDNDHYWEAAFSGYLSYSVQVYKILYFLLRENEHYAKAIETNFADSHVMERLVQHICVGYIEDWERLDDTNSLIVNVIRKKTLVHLSEIITFFWMRRDNPTLNLKEKIKPLWRLLFNVCSENELNIEFQKIVSHLSKWLSLIDEIDEEILGWLKLSAKYIQKDFNTAFFIEYLLKHAPKTPARVGQIYLKMLDEGIYPDYDREDIQKIVLVLYDQNEKEIADKICIRYLTDGFDFLEPVYARHRNVKT